MKLLRLLRPAPIYIIYHIISIHILKISWRLIKPTQMQGMAWKHSISMNQYRPPSSEETQNCSQSTKPTTIARPLCPNTIAHFHWTFRSIVKFLHHFLPQLPSYKGHHGCCCIEMLKYWWKSQNLDSSVPCTSHIGKVDDGWCIYIGSCKAKSFKTCPCPFKKPAICDVLHLVFYDLYRRAHEDAMWCQALLQCKHVKTVVHPWTSNHETKIRGIIAKVWISPFQGQSLDSLMIIVWFLWGSTSGNLPDAWIFCMAIRTGTSLASILGAMVMLNLPCLLVTSSILLSYAIYIYMHDMYLSLCVCA